MGQRPTRDDVQVKINMRTTKGRQNAHRQFFLNMNWSYEHKSVSFIDVAISNVRLKTIDASFSFSFSKRFHTLSTTRICTKQLDLYAQKDFTLFNGFSFYFMYKLLRLEFSYFWTKIRTENRMDNTINRHKALPKDTETWHSTK